MPSSTIKSNPLCLVHGDCGNELQSSLTYRPRTPRHSPISSQITTVIRPIPGDTDGTNNRFMEASWPRASPTESRQYTSEASLAAQPQSAQLPQNTPSVSTVLHARAVTTFTLATASSSTPDAHRGILDHTPKYTGSAGAKVKPSSFRVIFARKTFQSAASTGIKPPSRNSSLVHLSPSASSPTGTEADLSSYDPVSSRRRRLERMTAAKETSGDYAGTPSRASRHHATSRFDIHPPHDMVAIFAPFSCFLLILLRSGHGDLARGFYAKHGSLTRLVDIKRFRVKRFAPSGSESCNGAKYACS